MSSPTWIGQTLNGRYLIQDLLGQGGMSAVYKATDPNLKRVVAVKLIHSHLAGDTTFVQRFEEEAAAVASLRHPNIVQVYDFNSDKDVSFMVMEFVPGETLQDHLKRLSAQNRVMPLDQAIKFTLNICDALGYAHQRGMIHRDIKPANIMLDVFGQAILMDFGIVKIVGGNQHTATGAVMGTARYMSPELIRSEPADARSDIYSLGVTLYEMLSGRTPFSADSAMTLMMMHLNDPVPDPRMLRKDIPPALVAILNKALVKDKNLRYQSTAELAADLKKVQSVQPAAPMATEAATILPDVRRTNASTVATPPVLPGGLDAATQYERVPPNPTPPPGYSPPHGYRTQASPSGSYTPPPGYSGPVGSQDNATPPPGYAMPEAQKRNSRSLFLALGIGGAALIFITTAVLIGAFLLRNQFGGQETQSAGLPTQSDPLLVVGDFATQTPRPTATRDVQREVASTLTAVALLNPTNSQVPAATSTPPPTAIPTATMPPLYVRINGITIDSNQRYVVDYETFGYTEQLPGQHVHFFFDTVPPAQAGVPGNGPWILYGGPRPFTGYRVSDKPAAATHMCALVAESHHAVIAESGNCFGLP